jgi:hypothetical protein
LIVFALAALAAGAGFYALLGLGASYVPGTGGAATRLSLIVGAVIIAIWHGQSRFNWLPSSRRQMRKEVAAAGIRGAAVYGAVIGIGVLTIVTSPSVWVGFITVLVTGSSSWGAIYGASFATARMAYFLAQRRIGVPSDPTEVSRRVIKARRTWVPPVGVLGGICVACLAFFS